MANKVSSTPRDLYLSITEDERCKKHQAVHRWLHHQPKPAESASTSTAGRKP